MIHHLPTINCLPFVRTAQNLTAKLQIGLSAKMRGVTPYKVGVVRCGLPLFFEDTVPFRHFIWKVP